MQRTIKLFVGGLPPTLTKHELDAAFRDYQPSVRIDMKIDCTNNMNQGFAFLMVNDPVVASQIVGRQFTIRGRNIQVQFSKKKPKSQHMSPLRLFCRGIPEKITDRELTAFFEGIAPCRAAYAIKDSAGRRRGFGFIELHTAAGAQQLLSQRKFKFRGAQLVVEEYNRPYRLREFQFPQAKATNIGNPGFSHQSLARHTKRITEFTAPTGTNAAYTSNTLAGMYRSRAERSGAEALQHWGKDKVPNLQADSLLKIGPHIWIFRSPEQEIKLACEMHHHHQQNMRFNILKMNPSLNTKPK